MPAEHAGNVDQFVEENLIALKARSLRRRIVGFKDSGLKKTSPRPIPSAHQ